MKPKEISKLIEKEIDGDWSISNWHGCDLKKCLIRPKKRKLLTQHSEVKEYWIVLEEDPIDLEESKVYFNDENMIFGLAMYSEPFPYICNSFDTFIRAFKSM